MNLQLRIRDFKRADLNWAKEIFKRYWGSSIVVSRGNKYDINDLQGRVAVNNTGKIGLLTYVINDGECEVLTLYAMIRQSGVGTALIKDIEKKARRAGCNSIVLETTNDNLEAIKFYRKRGFGSMVIYPGGMKEARKLKPEIPLTGNYGIPIEDEIIFTRYL